jgi:Family of unknown function (DUF6011)
MASQRQPRRTEEHTMGTATAPQIRYITGLAASREVGSLAPFLTTEALTHLSGHNASRMIDALLAKPVKVSERRDAAPAAELEAGMYRKADGRIYKVQRAVHGSGKMTAKQLIAPSADGAYAARFEYQGLASRFVAADERMSLEEARQYGALYGVCCVCARTLTDEDSIAAGIGPVCAKGF